MKFFNHDDKPNAERRKEIIETYNITDLRILKSVIDHKQFELQELKNQYDEIKHYLLEKLKIEIDEIKSIDLGKN